MKIGSKTIACDAIEIQTSSTSTMLRAGKYGDFAAQFKDLQGAMA
jgi:hypothetical protein